MMLVNRKNDQTTVKLPVVGKSMDFVDQQNNKVNSRDLNSNQVTLNGFAVAVVEFS